MNDIFISYASEDRSRVQRLAIALQQRGRSVWWDRQIPAGQSFDDVIERELTDSVCVIVAWSATSVDSHWVREEAAIARERGVLVPVLLDHVAPPLGFGRIQAADLVEWNGDASAPEFERLLADVAGYFESAHTTTAAADAVHGESNTKSEEAPAPKRPPDRSWRAAAIAVAIIVVVSMLGVGLYQLNRHGSGEPEQWSDTTPQAEPSTTPQGNKELEAAPRQASSSSASDHVDLLSAEQGGQLLVADSNYWSQAADGKQQAFNFYASNAEAVYGFKDGRRASFDTFTVLIEETKGGNVKDFELLVGDDSPTGSFRSLGKFTTQNVKLFTTPFQPFTFEPTTARFLKVKLLSSHGQGYIGAREIQLLGQLAEEDPGSDPVEVTSVSAPSTDAVDLLSAEQGGQLLVADSNYWSQAADGKQQAFNFYASNAEAVYGFKDGRRASFDTFTVLIEETKGGNVKDFELLVGDDSPTGSFRSLGKFTTQNVKLFTTPFQPFTFEPTTARFLKVRLLSSHGQGYIGAREIQLLGQLAEEDPGSDPVEVTSVSAPSTDAVDLLSAEQGGQLLVADSNYWSQAADGKQQAFNFYASNAEAVYGFKDGRRATFDTFTVLIEETKGGNVKDFELLVGDDSPTGSFRSLGKFTTQNVKLFRTPFQPFTFEPTTARFLKVKLLSSHGQGYIGAREIQLWGKPDGKP